MADSAIQLGLVGVGKIARDQHLPAIADDPRFTLVATADPNAGIAGIANYSSFEAMIQAEPRLTAVSICTPPSARAMVARAAVAAGLHVMLEKPPAATVVEAVALADLARAGGTTLFATWHSREAASVDAARAWLAGRRINHARIDWLEDIRVWHPGQEWIMEAGGFGVFDPGINALSIATAILPRPLTVARADMRFPTNRAAPIAASLRLVHGEGTPIEVAFDFLRTGEQCWSIEVETDAGSLKLLDGGQNLLIDGEARASGSDKEYARLYAHFAELVKNGASDCDLRPLQLVADAFLLARRVETDAFDF